MEKTMKCFINNVLPKNRTTYFVRDNGVHEGTIIGFADARDMTYIIADKWDGEVIVLPVCDTCEDEMGMTFQHYRNLKKENEDLRKWNHTKDVQIDDLNKEISKLVSALAKAGITLDDADSKK